MTAHDIPFEDRRRFRTGRPCLDFTHTGGEGVYAVWELLHEPADVEFILGALLGVELRVSAADDASLRKLRAAITGAARGAALGAAPGPEDITAINTAAAHAPLVPRLTVAGVAVLERGTARQALSTLARDAIDLVSSPLAQRIRVCAAEDCGLLFVGASRPREAPLVLDGALRRPREKAHGTISDTQRRST